MSAIQTSVITDNRKLMPTARACTTASQASHSASTPATNRTGAGMRGQPATPARSSPALPSTQNAPPAIHSGANVRPVSPSAQEAPHSATINLVEGARALAFLRGRDYVLPEDMTELVPDVLRHRLVLSYQALAEGMTADAIIAKLMQHIPAPVKALESHVQTS